MKKRVLAAMVVIALPFVAAPQTDSAGFDTPECNAWARNPGSWGLAYECLYSIVGYY